jgi:hypothetical protein
MKYTCTKCNKEKEDVDFYNRKDRPKGKSATCKTCSNKRWQDYKKNNPEKIAKNFQNWKSKPKNQIRLKTLWKKRDSKVRKELSLFLKDYKSNNPCMDCKIQYPYYVMDFDHRPGEIKIACVGRIEKFKTIDKLTQEITKCDLVCSNCHRIRTHDRLK